MNLSAEEGKKYGSVNEQNKLFINKVYDYQNIQPELSSPDVDWEEFKRDYDSRSFLQDSISLRNTIPTANERYKTSTEHYTTPAQGYVTPNERYTPPTEDVATSTAK